MKPYLFFILLILISHLSARGPGQSDSSQVFTIESISVEGNSKSKTGVVLENLPFSAGDKVSEAEINEGVDALRRLELFKEVEFSPRPGSEPGFVHLIIRVKERYWPVIRFKGGYSELDGWYITPIGFHFDNIFGFGNFINLDFTIGDRLTSLNLNYINPNIFNSGLDFHSRLFIRTVAFLHYVDSLKLKQNVPQSGIMIGFRSREPFFNHFLVALETYSTIPDSFATYGSKSTKYYDFPEPIDRYVHDLWRTTAFTVNFNWDKRDQPGYPTKGWWIGSRFTQADKELGGDVNFWRFITDARYYQHIFSGTVAAARIKYGAISDAAPFYEKFYLGGPNSVRGYADRSIGPDGGGNQLLQTGVEIRFPLTRKNFPNHFLSGVLFWDGGMNLSDSESFNFEKMYQSAGFGFRFRVPFIGLVRIDMAYPLRDEEHRFHFSLGHTF